MSSTDVSANSSTDGVPTYMAGGDPAGRFTDYYPAWLDHLADDVTIECRTHLDQCGRNLRR